jgi:CheY-like chemotaxis protein
MGKMFNIEQVASLCGVDHAAINRWIAENKLKAVPTPNGHQVMHDDLLAFMKKFFIPVPKSIAKDTITVMAIDDEPDILAMLKAAFNQISPKIKFTAFSNPVDAISAIEKNPPNLLILDILMPNIDGIQVCTKLKTSRETAHIKILAITGKELKPQEEEFLSQNTDAFIKKPFSIENLIEQSKKLLGLYESIKV